MPTPGTDPAVPEGDINGRRCAVCKGAIHHRYGLGPARTRPWLHLYDENWVDEPHNVVPEVGTPGWPASI